MSNCEHPQPLLTIAEVASILRVRTTRAYAIARQGLLPGVVRIGRQVRVDPSELVKFVCAGGDRVPPESCPPERPKK